MTPRQSSATTLLVVALAVGGCDGPADPHGQSVSAGTPAVTAEHGVQPHTGSTRDSALASQPDPDGQARSPHPQPAGSHADHRHEVPRPVDAEANPPTDDGDPGHPGTDAPNLPPPGERTSAFAHHRRPSTDDAAPSSRHDSPRAAAVDIIETGLADQGLEVYAVTANLIEQAAATATVRVTALHRLNGPPRLSVYELDLAADAGVWTVVAHRPVQP